MNRINLLLLTLLFSFQGVVANELQTSINQEVLSEDNKAVVSIQKQPVETPINQKQDVKRNWFCIIVQVNGKLKGIDNE